MTMNKILVPAKRVPDPDQRIRTTDDGRAIETGDLHYVVNPFDLIAVEEALRIREDSPDAIEVVTVGIGSDDYEKELRVTLAMGADRTILVECDPSPDPWNVAVTLKAVVERERPDLVLMGKQAVDDDSNQAGQFLAALMDWPQATFASRIEIQDGTLTVDRETDAGIEQIAAAMPAVVTVDLRLNEPRYASMPAIMKSKRKPVERVSLADLEVTIEPRVELVGLEVIQSRRECRMVASVDELVDKLREGEVI